MRWLSLSSLCCSIALAGLVSVMLGGCGDDTSGAQDLAVRDASADFSTAAPMPDLAVLDASASVVDMMQPTCGEPSLPCCIDGNGVSSCNSSAAVCNGGVCVTCGVYPMGCCPGSVCVSGQTCITDPAAGTFCYPCGHDGEPCCFVGDACVEQGTSCVMPDGGDARCSM